MTPAELIRKVFNEPPKTLGPLCYVCHTESKDGNFFQASGLVMCKDCFPAFLKQAATPMDDYNSDGPRAGFLRRAK